MVVRLDSWILRDSPDVSKSPPNVEAHNVDPEKTGNEEVMHDEAQVDEAVRAVQENKIILSFQAC